MRCKTWTGPDGRWRWYVTEADEDGMNQPVDHSRRGFDRESEAWLDCRQTAAELGLEVEFDPYAA